MKTQEEVEALKFKWATKNAMVSKKKPDQATELAWCKHRLRQRGSLMKAEISEEAELRKL